MGVNLTIDALDWDNQSDALIESLGGFGTKATKTAVRHAVTKTAKWMRRQIAKLAADDIGIAQKTFDKSRVRIRMKEGELWEALIWVGTNPFPAHHLGKVRWNRRMKGARAGRRQFEGSFSWGEGRPIFERSTAARLPIDRVDVDVHESMRANIIRLEGRALSRYRTLLYQELNYQLLKIRGHV